MSDCTVLFPYIELFSTANFGEWFCDKENDGTMEHPIQLPFVTYTEAVESFIQDVHQCWDSLGLGEYLPVLNAYGIEWDFDSMSRADVDKLSAEAVLALLLAAVRAEQFCDGALLGFFKNGCISRWLMALKEKAEERK